MQRGKEWPPLFGTVSAWLFLRDLQRPWGKPGKMPPLQLGPAIAGSRHWQSENAILLIILHIQITNQSILNLLTVLEQVPAPRVQRKGGLCLSALVGWPREQCALAGLACCGNLLHFVIAVWLNFFLYIRKQFCPFWSSVSWELTLFCACCLIEFSFISILIRASSRTEC